MARSKNQKNDKSLTDDDRALIAAYVRFGEPSDQLAQEPSLAERFQRRLPARLKENAVRRLIYLRKQGLLPRLSNRNVPPTKQEDT